MYKYSSEHYDNIKTLWDQKTFERRDEWDEWYVNNLTFNYSLNFNKTAAENMDDTLYPYEISDRDP